ncbi:hypothetical protein BOTBODRAFT_133590 [Botryobasidium botryosum FD-172 SS1]|uniref:Uncharacterized protein n=1 Tax=Botryobasidium botryosum (strain FD-172 SS1) TaxID=930990 RepID=A0A067MC92_BOTB1|nr:hypothetical protein BOTBODRAFT_133590 [Botryobasidium botryosum FD-172 SS1]
MPPASKSETIDDSQLFAHAPRGKGKVVLITGGSSGIGRKAALAFAEHGAKIVIGDLNGQGALAVVAEIENLGGQAVSQRCDVTIWEDQLSLFQLAVKSFGRVDYVIANAGIPDVGAYVPVAGSPTKPNLLTLQVNLVGAIYTARLASYYFERNPSTDKSLILIGSMASLEGFSVTPVYSAAKHGVLGLARSLLPDLSAKGARVVTICPWSVDTPFIKIPGRLLLAGLPFAKTDRVVGAVVFGATDPNPTSNGSVYAIADDQEVFRVDHNELSLYSPITYGILSKRVHSVIRDTYGYYFGLAKDVVCAFLLRK